jgi:hypothetical protein
MTASVSQEYTLWINQKNNYLNNLKNGIGHRESILAILEKIDNKLNKLNCI